jgi:hypothetical protein
MIFLLASVWFYGRRSTTTGDFLLGEQHEDIFQTLLVCSSFFAGLGLGLPWSAIPIPVLSFLSLSLWITTRMVRIFTVEMPHISCNHPFQTPITALMLTLILSSFIHRCDIL